MRLQKLKIKQGAFETIVTCTAEMLENLGKFKLGALAKVPFIMKHRKIALLEAERAAPGREIAYIADARTEFK